MERVSRIDTAYAADRAAALAGVPTSTLHYWAREEILVPSVSQERVKLWSLADLMSLRTISWLRGSKANPAGHEIPATSMPAVRRALTALRGLDLSLWGTDGQSTVLVDHQGRIHIRQPSGMVVRPLRDGLQQVVADEVLDLAAPFFEQGRLGPDLRRPRPLLRIVPGKLAGAPHIAQTRLETEAVYALSQRGMSPARIATLYPFTSPAAISEAIDLEDQLHGKAA